MSALLLRGRAALRREAVLLATLILAALYFVYRWWTDLQRPGLNFPDGWWGYADQGFYLREAQALGRLDGIPVEQFEYGPGYPALGALFTRLGSGEGWPARDPFMIPNLGLWLLAVAACYLVGRRLYGEWAGVAAALGLMFATPLIGMVTLPWNTSVTMGAVAALMIVALRRDPGVPSGAVIGIAVGMAYSARYLDVVWVALAAIVLMVCRRILDPRRRAFWGAAGGFALVMGPTLALHAKAFGNPFTTSYTQDDVIGAKDFAWDNILRHAGESFVSAFHLGEERSGVVPLLAQFFLLALAPIGFVLALRAWRGRAARGLIAGFGAASALATVVYWSYWFTGSYGLQFGSLHFFKAWFALWIIGALVAVVEGGRRLMMFADGPRPADAAVSPPVAAPPQEPPAGG